MAIRETTFLKYQDIYLDFISERAATGCTQIQFCRKNSIPPMALSRAMKLASSGAVDFTRPFPGTAPDVSFPAIKKRRSFSPESVEFFEVFL